MEYKDIFINNSQTTIEKPEQRKLSFSRNDLDNILNNDYQPQKLINLFKKNFQTEYDADAGTWEGYSIEEHTLMVLNQFEKYFSQKLLPNNIDKNFFRVLLTLHDIGKPKAIMKGNKDLQHQYSTQIITNVLTQLQFNQDQIKLAQALISTDALGIYIDHNTYNESLNNIKQLSLYSNQNPTDFFELLTILYQVDASSYTKDSGGKKSLDHLFEFKPKEHTIRFSSKVNQHVEKLRQNITN